MALSTAANLVREWCFNEGTGSKSSATVPPGGEDADADSWTTAGRQGNAIRGDYAGAVYTGTIPATNTWSFACWVKTTGSGKVIKSGAGGVTIELFSDGRVLVEVGWSDTSAPAKFALDTWFYLAVTGSTVTGTKAYISADGATGPAVLLLANTNNTGPAPFGGRWPLGIDGTVSIDDFRIWNRDLTPTEIAESRDLLGPSNTAAPTTKSGASVGSVAWVGFALGKLVSKGVTAVGSVAWAGAAVGARPAVGIKSGSASGSAVWAGTAAGSKGGNYAPPAAVSLVDSTQSEQSTGTLIVGTAPGGSGDLLVAVVTHSMTTRVIPPAPSGWTLVASESTNATATGVYTAPGSAASYSWAVSSGRSTLFLMRWSGVDPTTPIDVTPTSIGTGVVTSVTAPTLTTTKAGVELLHIATVNASTSATADIPVGVTALQVTVSTGRRTVTGRETRAAAGVTDSRTWNLNPSTLPLQMTAFQVPLRPLGGGAEGPVTPTVTSRVVGVDGRVKVRTAAAASVRLKVGTDAAVTTGVVYTSAKAPDGDGFSDHQATGLVSGVYYYRVAVTDTGSTETLDTLTTAGRLMIAPTGQTSFSWCVSSCCNAADSTAMAAIAARGDAFFAHRGDLWYADGSGTGLANFRSKMDAKIVAPNHAKVFATMPVVYAPSDHDASMNNNGNVSTDATAMANFNTAYRERFPTPTLPSGGVYYSFMWGRVLFINLDCRSFASSPANTDNSSKSLLGAAQKQWVKDQLSGTSAKVAILLGDAPWVSTAFAGDDAWAGYTTERAELGAFFGTVSVKVAYVGGDMHALAANDGSSSAGGIPSFQASPLNQNSSVKGGPWTAGPYPSSGSSVVEQYGRMVVTDSGSSMSLAFTGYSADNTSRVSYTHVMDTSSGPPPEAAGSGSTSWVGTAAGRRVSKGVTAGTLAVVGSADGRQTPRGSASGTLGWVGVSAGRKTPRATASGTISTVGFAAGARVSRGTASGAAITAGFATGQRAAKATASGSISTVGASAGRRVPKAAATGSVSWAGAASGVHPALAVKAGSATGATSWAGGGAGKATRSGHGSGSTAWVGAAAGSRTPKALTVGSTSWVGAASGERAPKAAAAGSTAYAGSASGIAPVVGTKYGTGSGSVAWAGSASGSATRRASASGSTAWAGTATGKRVPKAASTGAVAWAGAATGIRPVVGGKSGSAAGSTAWAGTANGVTAKRGTSTGSVAWSGTTVGARNPKASATGSVVWAGSASGARPIVGAKTGTAAGSTAWVGVATGRVVRSATASGSWTIEGVGTGYAPVVGGKSGTAQGATVWAGIAVGIAARAGYSTGTVEWRGGGFGPVTFSRDISIRIGLAPARVAFSVAPKRHEIGVL